MSLTATGLEAALQSTDQSLRLRAAMMAGTYPSTEFIEVLVVQCAIESEFLVRDMLTWALIRNDPKLVVERLKPELNSEVAQARSQALHTLTKIGDTTTYPLVSGNLLFDADDRVAMTAWRAASLLVPERSIPALIPALLTQLGRGEFEIQFALSRALCSLGEEVLEPLAQRSKSATPEVAEHLAFTLRLLKNPYSESRLAREFAEKLKILKGAPAIGESTT
jgi:HEAT repeat protein